MTERLTLEHIRWLQDEIKRAMPSNHFRAINTLCDMAAQSLTLDAALLEASAIAISTIIVRTDRTAYLEGKLNRLYELRKLCRTLPPPPKEEV